MQLTSGGLCLAACVFVPGDTLPAPLNEILSGPQWYEEIANPSLTSPEQIEERVAKYERRFDRVKQQERALARAPDAGLKTEIEAATRLLTRFLDFARSTPDRELVFAGEALAIQMPRELSQGSKRQILERLQDAHARMREKWKAQIKLDLPPGFIFIKLYANREQMASDYTLGPDTAGVAFPCRYIAVALRDQEWDFWRHMRQFFIGEEFQQTVAHEFVHSFCFMTLGQRRAGGLPRWFMEGFALHVSGERRVRTAIEGPGGLMIRDFESTQEYQEFKQLFQFVLEKYGPAHLYEFARTSLEQGSVDHALSQVLNLANETALIGASVSWRRDKARFQQRLILITLSLVVAAFILFRGRWRKLSWLGALSSVWGATVYASASPYYVHTSVWWVPAALSLPLVYLIVQYARQRRSPESPGIRLVVVMDWPRRDELMEPWPYEEMNLAEIAQADTEDGWGWGAREITGSEARRVKEFLDSQSTDSFYFQGHAYRVWYEWLRPGADEPLDFHAPTS
jgi:hypothetical protein